MKTTHYFDAGRDASPSPPPPRLLLLLLLLLLLRTVML